MTTNPTLMAKNAAARIGLRPMGENTPRVVFFHVPKCGGTSIVNAIHSGIRRRWPLWRAPCLRLMAEPTRRAAKHFPEPELEYRARVLTYAMYQKHLASICGHMPCTAAVLEARQENDCFVTMLRDPRDRILSDYYYNRFKPRGNTSVFTDSDLEPWLEKCEPNRITAYFGASKEEAIQTLSHMDIIGNIQNVPAFVQGFREKLGMNLKIVHTRRSPVKYPKYADQPAHIRKKVDELVADDLEIFERFGS